ATLIPVMGATGGVVSAVAAISDVTLQRRQERMLIENDVTKTAMLSAIPDTLMRIDAEGRLVDIKDNAGLIHAHASELLGDVIWQRIIGADLGEAIMTAVRAARKIRGHTTAPFHSTEGAERHLDIRVAMCGPSDVLVILHDTTDRFRAETLMRDSETRLRYLIEGSADILTLVDANGNVTYQSPSVFQSLGFEETELLGKPLCAFIEKEERSSVALALMQLKKIEDGKTRFYARIPHKDGSLRDLEVYGRNLLNNKYVNAIVLNVRDVTERKGLERELQRRVEEVQAANGQLEEANKVLAQRATTDGLTGLRNHRTSQEYLTAAVQHCQRVGKPLSLAVLDVDFFKKINDTQGHQEGDRVLQWLAVMVQKACRGLHLAGRYGGEEFILIMPETNASSAYQQVEMLRRRIENECNRGYPVTVSIGLVTSDSLMETSASLFATADKALYASKQGGRNRVTAVDQSIRRAA
ncbi:MAG: diguanylate cyclase, partial [Armatimonadota bacterium]